MNFHYFDGKNQITFFYLINNLCDTCQPPITTFNEQHDFICQPFSPTFSDPMQYLMTNEERQ